jgi:hypothetical protein
MIVLAVFSQAAGINACNNAAKAATNNVIENPIANIKCSPNVSSTDRGCSKKSLLIMVSSPVVEAPYQLQLRIISQKFNDFPLFCDFITLYI